MPNGTEELDYDYDAVIEFCKGTAVQTSFSDSSKDLNSLSTALTTVEDSLHCGLETCPAFLEIYDGFSGALGYYDGSNGSGTSLLMAYAAAIFNTCYSEALRDKSILEDTPISDLTGGTNPDGSSNASIADEVIQGKWGSGEERRRRLQEAGYDPDAIQKIVNEKVNGTYKEGQEGGGAAPETPAPTPTPTAAPETPAPETPAPAPEAPADTPAPTVPPGTTPDSAATAAALGLTPEQLDIVKATIRHEAGNNPAEIANVASCIKNRMNSGAWGGTDPYSIVTAKGQFSSYLGGYYKQYTGGNYYQGDPATAASVDETINAILLGTIPPTHSYQSFRSSGSPSGTQLTPGGNKYR